MGIQEFEISQIGIITALEIYKSAYEKRYRTQPIINDCADQTTIRDIVRKVGLDKTCELIKTYLAMSDDWFVTKAHSLDELKRNINKVNTEWAKKKPVFRPQTVVVAWTLTCDRCKKTFSKALPDPQLPELPYLCERCT